MHARSIRFALGALGLCYGCVGTPEDASLETVSIDQALRVSTPEDPNPPPPPPRNPSPPPPPPTANPNPGPITVIPTTYSDLQLDGTMRYYGGGTPTLGMQIDVTNHGTGPAYGPSGRVIVAGAVLNTALYQYYGGTSTQSNTVNPMQRGYLQVEVPANLLTSCAYYQVSIDIDRTMQVGDDSVYANDMASVSTICPLTWTSPIDTRHLGYPPAPEIAGETLQVIVSSFQSGRPDGWLCSRCHNRYPNSTYPSIFYKPNVNQDEGFLIGPYDTIGDRTWAIGSQSWAQLFVTLTKYPHTEALKSLFYKWINDGAGP